MNVKELDQMKRLMKVINDNVDGRCPICGDELSATIGGLQPRWSDYFDNIVCYDCATRATDDCRVERTTLNGTTFLGDPQ